MRRRPIRTGWSRAAARTAGWPWTPSQPVNPGQGKTQHITILCLLSPHCSSATQQDHGLCPHPPPTAPFPRLDHLLQPPPPPPALLRDASKLDHTHHRNLSHPGTSWLTECRCDQNQLLKAILLIGREKTHF